MMAVSGLKVSVWQSSVSLWLGFRFHRGFLRTCRQPSPNFFVHATFLTMTKTKDLYLILNIVMYISYWNFSLFTYLFTSWFKMTLAIQHFFFFLKDFLTFWLLTIEIVLAPGYKKLGYITPTILTKQCNQMSGSFWIWGMENSNFDEDKIHTATVTLQMEVETKNITIKEIIVIIYFFCI